MAIGTVHAGRRGVQGPEGPATDWRTSGGWLQYRAVGSTGSWTNAVLLSELTAGATSAFTFKGQVANTGALPASGNTTGDAYLITGSANLYVWNGSSWVGPTAVVGPAGADGDDGVDGADGADGQGVPTGGTVNQVLAKTSSTNYATAWVDPATGGGVSTWEEVTETPDFPAAIAAGDTAAEARDAIGALGAGEVPAEDVTVDTSDGLQGPTVQSALQGAQDQLNALEDFVANLTLA